MTLTPAYGRDYTSKKSVLADFLAGKDFILNDVGSRWDGEPINKEQIEEEGKTTVRVRYKRLTRVGVLEKKGDTWRAA